MNEKIIKILIIVLTVSVLAGLLYFGSYGGKVENLQTQSNQPESTETAEKAKISGSFTYPGENIPSNMSACVEYAETKQKVTCSTEQIKSEDFIYGVGYEIEVEPGEYYVNVDQGNTKAYFNGYISKVTKGVWPDYDKSKCSADYQPIKITVQAGQEFSDATLADWYFEAECSTDN